MIELIAHAEGTILPVKGQPGSRQNSLRGEQDGALKVCVTQAAEKGKANQAIIAVLAKSLKLKKSQIELLSGDTISRKKFLIRQINPSELQKRLDSALSPT